jgi:DNA-binding Lrp family transcriptional regulator
MDETDIIILKKLMENSRVTYRELAEILGISASSTHKRINKLVDDEIIQRFTTRPSALALKYLLILIYGISNAKSLEAVSQELGQHESVDNVAIATGKMLYISGILRDISELQEFSSFATNTAQISEPTVGIINVPYITTPEPLTTIDYKILKTLNNDARKPVTDIADDVGLSAKTVKKRLEIMGYSYGGWLASLYALSYQERLNKLILLCPASALRPRIKLLIRTILQYVIHTHYMAKKYVYWMYADSVRKNEETRKYVDEMISEEMLARRSFKKRKFINPTVLTDEDWKNLKVPTLFLTGENEIIYSAEKAIRYLNELNPDIKTEKISDAGHDLPIVKPEWVISEVLKFLK